MSDSPNYVRRMAECFEKIIKDSKVYGSGHEISFKHCNWWLETPDSGQYFDDSSNEAYSSRCNTNSNLVDIETTKVANNDYLHLTSEHPERNKCGNDSIETHQSCQFGLLPNENKLNINSHEASSKHTWPLFRSSYESIDTGSVESTNQVTNTIEELLFNEDTYVRALNQGIQGYVKNFNRQNMPADLRGQMNRVFGNVVQIKYFHENIFYPALKECMMDIIKICKTFCAFIEQDYFYIYILYAINRQKSDAICGAHRNYFKQIQNEIGDRLGVNSFLVQPIQRLPKYKLLLGQLFSELGKRFDLHDDRIKNEIAACCLAEKQLQRLLDAMNGSMNVNDIVDCIELHPLCQGKFKLVDKFDIGERGDLRRRYKGKVFMFEKCIIYTEISAKNRLSYKGHFHQATLGLTFDCPRNYFCLYNERKGQQEVEFSTESLTLQLWLKMLGYTMAPVVLSEKQKIEENRRTTAKSDFKLLQSMLQIDSADSTDSAIATSQSEKIDLPFITFQDASKEKGGRMGSNIAAESNAYDSISTNSSRSTDSESRKTIWYIEYE